MVHFRLRIDQQGDVTVDALETFLRNYKACILVHHKLPHGNPHWHAYVDATNNTIGIEAVRNRLKKRFELPSGSYSLKNCDVDKVNEYIQYLFNTKHGNKWHIAFVHNISDDIITTAQQAAQEVSTNYEQSRKTKSTVTMYELAEEVAENMKLKDKTIENYVLTAVAVCRRHRKAFCKFTLAKIISTAREDSALVKTMQEYFHEL